MWTQCVRVGALAAISLAAAGCTVGAVATKAGPSFAAASPAMADLNPRPEGSLFKEDTDAVSNDAMNAILAQTIALPDRGKLTVVRFGNLPYWWGWDENFVRVSKQLDDDFLGRLGQSARVREVAYLPSLVTPPVMTLPKLRTAAARFQSDLLLVYRTQTQTYRRQRLFKDDDTRAYCTVEAILLDVRTGLIPFSTIVTEQFSATKTKDDYDFDEIVAKASQQAIAKAWLELADRTAAFLAKQPPAATPPATQPSGL